MPERLNLNRAVVTSAQKKRLKKGRSNWICDRGRRLCCVLRTVPDKPSAFIRSMPTASGGTRPTSHFKTTSQTRKPYHIEPCNERLVRRCFNQPVSGSVGHMRPLDGTWLLKGTLSLLSDGGPRATKPTDLVFRSDDFTIIAVAFERCRTAGTNPHETAKARRCRG